MAVIQQTTTKKTWFGYQCAKSRKTYHRAKKMHSNHPSSASKASVVSASKKYKKKLNYFIRKHKKDTQNKLRKLRSKSPKQFWKILNSLQSKTENKDISMNDLYNFFKDIYSPSDSHDPESKNLNFSIDNDD